LPPPSGSALTLYVCGPTVYDRLHLGNFRTFVTFDLFRRALADRGYTVQQAVNITDVDDKMIRRAQEEGLSVPELAAKYLALYREDRRRLGILTPHAEPRATDYVAAMVADIARLVELGIAYVLPGGDVFFRTRRAVGYGALSGQDPSALAVGARIEPDPRKEDPLDFALWKAQRPGEPFWPSPWGPGRPGWHMECTTMVRSLFGERTDVHGGGVDLVFPHHENERAQTNALLGHEAVGHWMHGGLLMTEGEKMSKSLGNTLSLEVLTARYAPMALRLCLISTHYRRPLLVTDEALSAAQQGWQRLVSCLSDLETRLAEAPEATPSEADRRLLAALAISREAIRDALAADLNAAQAVGQLFEVTRRINSALREEVTREGLRRAREAYLALWELLGLEPPAQTWRGMGPVAEGALSAAEEKVQQLVAQREEARRARDFARADALRTELRQMGVVVEDTPSGPRWQWKERP
jgi:cysteinyl-tRNA synthetase